ncbi:MAG: flavoprotein [Candidatus Taylorbacteria bacterium]|nr:flavoprotein [Candidatus Taylorbacteria bacterium]
MKETAQKTPRTRTKTYDVVVIGGGPAGMMAAGRAAELGKKVLLIEKNDGLGKKLLITGGGRCNVTNATFDNRVLLKKYSGGTTESGSIAEQFLFSPYSQFDVKQTMHFFESRGMKMKTENENRVFPLSNTARSVWEVMTRYVKNAGADVGGSVETLMNISVMGFVTEADEKGEKASVKNPSKIIAVKVKPTKGGTGRMEKFGFEVGPAGAEIEAKHFILAAGGTSRPETGSTGDGFKWLAEIGHNVTTPVPSLVPITIREPWIKRLAGLSMTGIKVSVFQGDAVSGGISDETKRPLVKKYETKRTAIKDTKVLFTHVGLSGPTILNMSASIRELLEYQSEDGAVYISIDLLPKFDYGMLNKHLQDLFIENGKKKFRNSLADLLPSTLTPVIIDRLVEITTDASGPTAGKPIDPEKPTNLVSREERLALVQLIKHFNLTVKGLLGFEKAIIASGGIDIREVDSKTMQSRLYPNLSVTGDILDIDRPSGGYSLQLCWTSGYVAGTHAASSK